MIEWLYEKILSLSNILGLLLFVLFSLVVFCIIGVVIGHHVQVHWIFLLLFLVGDFKENFKIDDAFVLCISLIINEFALFHVLFGLAEFLLDLFFDEIWVGEMLTIDIDRLDLFDSESWEFGESFFQF